MTMTQTDITTIIFDADDTLWDCQTWFDRAEEQLADMLKPWVSDRQRVADSLFAI